MAVNSYRGHRKPGVDFRNANKSTGIWCRAHVCPVGTHGMAYGAGTRCAGVHQGGTFLDICPVWVSWTDEDVEFGYGPVVAYGCYVHMFSTILLVEKGWGQLISLWLSTIAPSG